MSRIATRLTASLAAMLAFAEAPGAQELLEAVEPGHAERLAEYNSVFLQRATYPAARFRIVKPNTELLERDDDIKITLFDDVAPLLVREGNVQRSPDGIYWYGTIETDVQPPNTLTPEQRLVAEPSAIILLQRWDTDRSGAASLSSQNQFQFSPRWRIDEANRPVLSPPEAGSENLIVGRPPQTQEEIARHKELLQLDKRAFGSVTVNLSLPGGKRYFVFPLEFTPRYSVVIEEDPAKAIPVAADPDPELADIRPPEDVARWEQYKRFMDGLPREENKTVRGDLQ